ncbi:MAG: cyclic nucleotide-binding domain-containing protein [Myxococcales bacterium]|nr:cyclic nucleotide-binding domain-containing protein [Myxococcales bacterium]
MNQSPTPSFDFTSAQRLEVLGAVPPLMGLSDEDRRALGAVMRTVSVRKGAHVVREGDRGDAMYVVAVGSVSVMHRGVALGTLRRGQHFGEVALVVGGRRTASVIADEDCLLLSLDDDGLAELTRERPQLAVQLLREVVSSVSSHLSRMNETVSLLLQERALPRRVELDVNVDGVPHVVPTGTVADELLPTHVDGVPVVAALVDGRARALGSPLVGSCRVSPLTTAHWEGQRIFRQSLGLATLEAARRIGLRLSLGPSLGFSRRLTLLNPDGGAPDNGFSGNGEPRDATEQHTSATFHRPDAAKRPYGHFESPYAVTTPNQPISPLVTMAVTAAELQQSLTELVERDVPLIRERLGVLEAVDYFEREGAIETVRLLETTRNRTVAVLAYGEVFALETGPLLPSTGRLSGFEVVADGDGLLLVYGVKGHRREVPPNAGASERQALQDCRPASDLARRVSKQVMQMTLSQQRWLRTLQMHSVGDFNRACIDGAVEPLIRVAEGFHEKRICHIADAIAARRDEIRLISIAGPSSSGKSTFIRRLSVQLQVNGMQPVALGLDDYYVDRVHTPIGPDGEYDFESIEALQLDLLQEHLAALVEGKPVRTARYDFRTGTSSPDGGELMQLFPEDLLLVEGIHGLNPRLADALPEERVFRIFVCPLIQLPIDRLTQVHASDLRLLRRIVRDRHGRSLSAAETIRRWPNVRRGERLHIFPYQDHADAVFDTSLVYEISVLKVFAERYLLEVPPADPAQATAERLLDLLDAWVTIYPDHVPTTSLLREFIGGSGFSY